MRHIIITNPETGSSYLFTKEDIFISFIKEKDLGKHRVTTLRIGYEDLGEGWEINQGQKALEELTAEEFTAEDIQEINESTESGVHYLRDGRNIYAEIHDIDHPYHFLQHKFHF